MEILQFLWMENREWAAWREVVHHDRFAPPVCIIINTIFINYIIVFILSISIGMG